MSDYTCVKCGESGLNQYGHGRYDGTFSCDDKPETETKKEERRVMTGIIYCPACNKMAGASGAVVPRNYLVDVCNCDNPQTYSQIKKERDELRVELKALAKLIHYPDCWDTAAYPNLSDAMGGITEYYFACTECVERKAE